MAILITIVLISIILSLVISKLINFKYKSTQTPPNDWGDKEGEIPEEESSIENL